MLQRRRLVLSTLAALLLFTPSAASAQWFGSVYMGANNTRPSEIKLKGDGYDTTFPPVEFEAKSFTSPQYYGYRLGRFLSDTRRVGVEFEFIHLKVIAKPEQLGPDVQRYSMTHGLNYLLVNLVSRKPFGRSAYGDAPYALISSLGAGITLPHAETTILGVAREQYEYGGPGAHAGLGLDVRLKGRLSLLTEYKLTYSRPTISTAHNGTGQVTALSHHLAVGLAFGLSR
jgi:hypothetical protein